MTLYGFKRDLVVFKLNLRKEEAKYIVELRANSLPFGARRKHLGRRQGQDGPYFCS